MDSGATVKKEATILELATDIGAMLGDFQTRLDSRFHRHGREVATKEEAPAISNVLDEIIGVLEKDNERLGCIMSFISSEVLPKIN